MPRLISFALTEPQVRNRSKTQTRRLGWAKTKPGEHLTGCRKVMGRRRADGTVEPLVRIAEIEVVSARREPLSAITAEDVAAEGFPGWTPAEFVEFFCRSMKVPPDVEVTRLEFRYLDTAATATQTTEFDDRMLDALAAAINLNDPTPANLADRALAHIQQDGTQ